jgi:hypothetical protein|eukprot:COSAG01_NODE_980_length_12356_cov_77.766093_11_plen_137_part_00
MYIDSAVRYRMHTPAGPAGRAISRSAQIGPGPICASTAARSYLLFYIYTGSTGTVRYLQSIGTILPTRTSTVQYLQYRTIYEYGKRPYRPWYRQWTAHSDRALDQGAADQSVQWLLATSTYTALQRCSTVAGTVQL